MSKKFTEDQLNWILSVDSTEAQQGIRQLTKANRELEKVNKERRQEMYKLEMQNKTETESYRNLTQVIKKNDTQINSNRALMKALEGTMGLTSLTMVQLKKKAQDLQRQMDNTSKALHPAEYNKLQTELGKVKGRMDELKTAGKKTEESLGNIIKTKVSVATFIGNMYTKAVEVLGQMVVKAKEFVSEGIRMASVSQGIERAFNRISTPETLSELREATKGTVNNLELMKSAVRADNFQIPLKQLATYLQFAKQRAQETGESVDYLTNSIVMGIGRKSTLILDNLGISAVRIQEEVAKTGDFAKAVSKIVSEEMAKSSAAIDTAADKAQQRAVQWQNIQLSIGQRLTGVTGALTGVYQSFINVINDWVDIPTVQKLQDEQRETNLLARSIIAATGMSDARRLLIEEMQRQYPSFLANLDIEKLTNEQLAERLREVNKEYEERVRAQVLNDKILSPLQKKQKSLIEEQMKGITELNKIAEAYPDKLSKGFIEAIRSGNVLKMSSKDIQKELSVLQPKVKGLAALASGVTTAITGNGTAGLFAARMASKATGIAESDIERTIKRLGEIPSELEGINKEMTATTEQIASFGKTSGKPDDDPVIETKGKLEQYEEERKKLLEERLKLTEDTAIREKNIEIKALDEKIAKLQEYGVEKEKKEKKEVKINSLETLRKQDKDKLNLLRNSYEQELSVVDACEKQKSVVLKKSLADGTLTQRQYDLLNLSMDTANAEKRLEIEQAYAEDVASIELETGEGKTRAIEEASLKVLDADLKAAQARATQQKEFQKATSAVSDFKGKFNVLTSEEETGLQLKVLKASYDAAKELANGNEEALIELDAAYEQARTNITQEGENKRNQIRSQYGLLSMQDQYDMEMDQLQQQYDQGLINEEEYQKAKNMIKANYLKKSYDTYANMFSGAITALQDAELANIDAKYDTEIQRAGDNTEEVERLEKEKENKKLAVQKKYAGVQFAIKVSEIIANTAVAIMQAFAQLGPIGGAIAAAMLGATGIANIAVANAERKKVMNMSVEGGSPSGSGARVATGKQSGGYIDVVRAQDGKEFNAELDPDKRGFVDKPTVIVGEGPAGNSREWVASNAALENPTVVPFINVLNDAQEKGVIRTVDMNQMMRKRLAGFESGGSISVPVPSFAQTKEALLPSTSVAGCDAISKLYDLLRKIDREGGLKAYVIYSEFQKEQARLEESRKIGSK